jgi:diaminopimelate epimerase
MNDMQEGFMHFTKWQACGNDFVFVNAMTMDIRPVVKKCVSICNRNFGIGADGIIFVLPSEKATLQMRIFNSDGSEAEMCGNGIRAFAKWAHELGLVSKHHFSVETGAGILFPELLPDGKVRVDMGVPHLNSSEIPVTGFGDGMVVNRKLTNNLHTYRITCVSMGNPHCVIFTDDIDRISLEEIGSRLEADAHFPRKTNVEFAQLLKKNLLRMRVWERGTGVTMACGTGTCATVVAAILNGLVEKEAEVILDGGNLHISWESDSSAHVFMTGPAEKVFEGEYII